MDKEKLTKLRKSLKIDEYIISGYHPQEVVKRINKLKLTGTARKQAMMDCYIEPCIGKRELTTAQLKGPIKRSE